MCGELGCSDICEKDCDNNLTKEQIEEELKKVDKELEELNKEEK
jgi:hypothetical protein